ncbi:MAG TPA: MotA/TolQ/ExbB proton channel family protein [Nitrospiria bacterium]|nr:MotA/TolQ/ExbB proton channel family protein [Nitrospiria bacterium]
MGHLGGLAFSLKHSTLEGQIIMIALLIFSLVSWTVIINKFRQLRKTRRRNAQFLSLYSAGNSALEISTQEKSLEGSSLFDVYREACDELKRQLNKYGNKIPLHGMSAVRIAIERGMGETTVNLESGMIILATAISGGPFVGLLGTVWGVMDTFAGIARSQQASLTAMAPGVSAALINTVVGLSIAIPSLFCYNYLVTKIREITIEMDNFAAHLDNVLATEYLSHKITDAPLSTGTMPGVDSQTGQQGAYPLTGTAHPGTV